MIRFPKKWRHLAPAKPGESLDRLVSFVDFPPTVLSLLGLPIPEYMQGVPFLGQAAGEPREYVFAARDRVDEAYDLARAVRDRRFLYARNYMPHLSYNQPSYYSDLGEIRDEITRLAAQGKLNDTQMAYAGPTRALEELYDSEKDPHQIHNLAHSPAHRPILERLRARLRQWMAETRDVGFLPETEIWRRSKAATPCAMARQPGEYPQDRVIAAADLVGRGRAVLGKQVELLSDEDAAVRYWAAIGLRAQGQDARSARDALARALSDPAPAVRIEAAAALAALGGADQALPVLVNELKGDDATARVRAARALQLLGETARPALGAMKDALGAATKQRGDPAMFVRFALQPAVETLEP
jgi:hypothetical protein